MTTTHIHLADCLQQTLLDDPARAVSGGLVDLDGQRFYRIGNVDRMPPFFMSLVSASDLWMFVASNGGLTAGRVDAESALFPYSTHDKIVAGADVAGPTTLLRVHRGGTPYLWEPFTDTARRLYAVERNLYKSELGNALVLETINRDLGLAFRAGWRFSDRFGVVRTAELRNLGGAAVAVDALDGLENLLPAGVTPQLQSSMSNLLDAYKRSELDGASGLGMFAMSSTLTDLAEPSESLRATTAWQVGLDASAYLVCSDQLEAFRQGRPIRSESDVRGRRSAFFVRAELALEPGEAHGWRIVADVEQDHADVVALRNRLLGDREALAAELDADVRAGEDALAAILARADGQQWTAQPAATARHAASVLFNVMRGGTVVADTLNLDDLRDFVATRHPALLEEHASFFDALDEGTTYGDLVAAASERGDPDLERTCRTYLPLAFSRRHGDPSRPWNRFAIKIRHPDGRPRLDYQGNWRDIFQNWEALAHAFPAYVEGMVATFLNATTADGYNPYRITRDGIEWEAPEPDNPWANIGYWSDHQIIYLQKLLEVSNAYHPRALDALLERRIFSHADVPYRIKPYEALLEDPYDTIAFDRERHERIEAAAERDGSDAKLVRSEDGAVVHATMAEKLLLLLLVKLANLVPEGGLWMNTQRPEWNDANNALVGKGLSVVTIGYLVRYVRFLQGLLGRGEGALEVGTDLAAFLGDVDDVLGSHHDALESGFDDVRRRTVMDALGRAGSTYRSAVYRDGPAAERRAVDRGEVLAFLARAQAWLEHTLRANRRDDALFHSYNLLELDEGTASVRYLYEMLEGQVSVLSSELLSPEDSLALLASLRSSRLYRADQHSYILYPDRDLPGFLAKNQIPEGALDGVDLVDELLGRGDRSLIVRDVDGGLHFQGDIRNVRDVHDRLDALAEEPDLAASAAAARDRIEDVFEAVFDHDSFTGRSGSFFAYEGLGSIYWHMVSKLLLAVQETWRRAVADGASRDVVAELDRAYYDVRAGLGFAKSPEVYGAVPTDPYSHTPAHAGAQQPGMTGQVKEDVLTRIGELGVDVDGGRLGFAPGLLHRDEFFADATEVSRWGGAPSAPVAIPAGGLAFTVCGVPVVYELDDSLEDGVSRIEVTRSDGSRSHVEGAKLDAALSEAVFSRRGDVAQLRVRLPGSSVSAAG